MEKLKIVYKNIGDLAPYKNNPRLNADAIPAVAASIKEFGFKIPVIVDSNNVLVCGHTRVEAAKTLGMTEVPCIVASDLDDEQIRAFRLVDNQVSTLSGWDFPKLDFEIEALETDGWNMADFGFINYKDEEPFGGFGDDPAPGEDDEPMGGEGEKLYPVIVNCHTEEDREMVMEMMEAEGRSCRKLR